MGYRKTAKADQDIIGIYLEGVRLFGEAQAEAYFLQLETCFELLAAHPHMARLRTEFTPALRMHPLGAHVVVHLEEDEGVLIVRVLHGRQDWLALLADGAD